MTEPATRLLYLDDMAHAYQRSFQATVLRAGADHVVLDQTLFYPEGGGQETDTGILEWPGGSVRVVRCEKKGPILHRVQGTPPPVGTKVQGTIDWERRHAHMRMHTSQHLISGLAYDLFGGVRTVGNQLHADRSRIDFRPAKWGDEELQRLEDETNRILSTPRPVRILFEDRTTLAARVKPDRANLDLLPAQVQRLRVIEVEGLDACPCGGTHVQNVAEIGRVKMLSRSAKGTETTRIEYELVPPTA